MRHLIFVLFSLCVNSTATAEPHNTNSAAHAGVFVENKGQLHDQHGGPRPDLDFCFDGGDVKVFVGDGAIHYQFSRIAEQKTGSEESALSVYRMDVTLLGANKNAEIERGTLQPYYERYYTPGTNEEGVRVASAEKIIYHNVYPNIDWVLFSKGGKLKHEFVVHAGGNVNDIRLQYEGADNVSLDTKGRLVASTPFGEIIEDAPYSYDEFNRPISSSYVLEGTVLGYKAGACSGTLTIDPSVTWSTFYGGTGNDNGEYTVTDPAGNVYLLLYGSSAGLATTGAFLTTLAGSSDAIIVQFNSAGVRQWATYYGGAASESVYAGATDVAGNIYVVGTTKSPSGISTPGSFDPTYSPGTFTSSDGFMVKLDNTGARLWGTYYGGTLDDYISTVTVDASGDVFIGGGTYSSGGIASAGAHQTTHGSSSLSDGFVARFTSSGSRVWSTYYGGHLTDAITGLATDASGNLYAVGYSYSPSAIATAGSHQAVHGATSGPDAFLVKFNSAGVRQWGTYYGGDQWDMGFAVAVDNYKNIYIGGDTRSLTAIASPGAHQATIGGGTTTYSDCFLAKFDSVGTRLWGTYNGGDKNDKISAISINGAENVIVAGESASTSGIATGGGTPTLFNGFYAKFSSVGVRHWGAYFGGSSDDYVRSLANVAGGGFYIAGQTTSISGIATSGAFQTVKSTGSDAFLAKISDCNLPDAGIVSGSSIVCVSGNTTFTVPVTGGIWSATNANATVGAAGVVTGNTPGLDTIRYTVSNSCGTTVASKVVSVSATAGSITGASSVCVGSDITLGATVGGGSWSSGSASIAAVGSATGLVSGLMPGTAIISYSIPGCVATRIQTINALPAAIGGVLSVCPGATTALTDATPGGTWSSGSTAIATVGATTGMVNGVSAGVVNVSYRLPTACYIVAAVTVNPLPAAIAGASTVCTGASTPLSSTTTGGTWTCTPGVSIGSATGVVTGISTGTAAVTYTLPTGCYVAHAMTVNSSPAAITGTLMACAGGAMALANATPGGAWTSGSTSVATVGLTTGAVVAIAAGTANVTYSLTNGCRAVAMVSVYAVPTSITGIATVCAGDSTIFACTAAGGSWSSGSLSIATAGSGTGKIYGVTAGTASITYAMPAGCMTSRIVTVNVSPSGITGAPAICEGEATSLTSTPAGGSWSSSTSSVASIGSLTGVVTAASAGTTTISYVLSTGCRVTYFMSVNAAPGTISGGTTVCVGGTLLLVNPVAGGLWSSTGTVATVSATGVVTATATGTIMVTYTMPAGCDTTSEITILDLPAAASVSGAATVCVDHEIVLSSSAPGGAWSSSNGNAGVVDGTVHGLVVGSVTINYSMSNVCGTVATGHEMTVVPATDCGTGVDDASGKTAALVCYPNPSDGRFIISLHTGHSGTIQLVVSDVLGRHILESETSAYAEVAVQVQAKGIYFVSVMAGGELYSAKVVVE